MDTDKKNKILFISPYIKTGGLERILINYIDILKDNFDITCAIEFDLKSENHLLRYVNSNYFFINNSFLSKVLTYQRTLSKKISLTTPFYLVCMTFVRFINSIKLRNQIKKQGFEHVIYFYQNSIFNFLPIKSVKKYIWLHQSYKTLPFYLKFLLYIKLYISDKIVCISLEMINDLPNSFKDKSELIYNPINIENKSFSKNENLKNNIIVSIGRIDEKQKDFKVLLDGFNMFNNNIHPKYNLQIIGDGPDLLYLKQYLITKKYNNISFLGRKKNPYKYILNSKFLVHSSKFEGFPTVLLEAIHLNKKFLSSDCKTGPKELHNEGFGYLFKSGDQIDLANKLTEYHKLMSSEPKYTKNQIQYLNNFKGKQTKEKFISLINSK